MRDVDSYWVDVVVWHVMCSEAEVYGVGFFVFKQKTAYDMGISDWSSDVCSSDLGQSIYKSDLYRMEFKIHRIVRKGIRVKVDSSVYLQAGDTLFVEGNAKKLLKLKDKEGIDIVGDILVNKARSRQRDQHIAELLINKNSRLINQTLRTNEFKKRWGLVALALHRPGKKDIVEIKNIPLQMGDILLVQGKDRKSTRLNSSH